MMGWMLVDLAPWLAKAAWGLLVVMALLFLTQGTASDRTFAIGLLAGLGVAAGLYRGPFRRWLHARRPVADAARPAAAAAAAGPSGDTDMPAVLAALGVPLDTGVGTPLSALTGALAKTTVYRAHQAILHGRPAEALELLDPLLAKPDLDRQIAGVAHYLRGGVYIDQGEREEVLAEITRARELAPDNPVIGRAYESLARAHAEAPMRFYAPSLAGTTELRRHRLGDSHEAILRQHPPADQQEGPVKYLCTLAVHASADGAPALFVASELNRHYSPDREGSESHFLGVFPGQGHVNLGASNDWAELDKLEARGLSVAREHLGLGSSRTPPAPVRQPAVRRHWAHECSALWTPSDGGKP